MPEIERVLFVQSSAVIDQQRTVVNDLLTERLGASVTFASSPEEVQVGSEFDVVIAPTVPWLPELLGRIQSVEWIHFLSSGVEKIWQMGVDWTAYKLTSSKGVHSVTISEYVLGGMLHFAKRFDQFMAQAHEGIWNREWLSELTDSTVVIVGAGNIGRVVAERCRFLGMNPILVARTPRADSEFGQVFGFGDLRTVVTTADYLVVAVPHTPETIALVDDQVLSRLKQGTVLIDVSRGGVVPNDAVVRALDGGYLRGAALDVFDEEPLPADSPLWRRPNVLLTPHVAGTTPRYMQRALELFLENAERFTASAQLLTPVDPQRRY